MKKIIKVIACFVMAAVLAGGGYIAGQRAKQSSIVSALPKNILNIPLENNKNDEIDEPQNDDNGEIIPPVATDKPNEVRIIDKTDKSAVDESWSVVKSSANTTDNGSLTLYTSAQKDEEGFLWDDTQKWVLEVSGGDGGYYTLFDQSITNGSVYFDVLETENGTKTINVYVFGGTGTTIKKYTRTENGFSEMNVYETGNVNKVFTTIPMYE